MEDWAEIRRLHKAEGMPIKAIVRRLGVARNTVRAALASDEPPAYRRAPRGSLVDAVEPEIRKWLRVDAKIRASIEEVRREGDGDSSDTMCSLCVVSVLHVRSDALPRQLHDFPFLRRSRPRAVSPTRRSVP